MINSPVKLPSTQLEDESSSAQPEHSHSAQAETTPTSCFAMTNTEKEKQPDSHSIHQQEYTATPLRRLKLNTIKECQQSRFYIEGTKFETSAEVISFVPN